MAIDIPHLPSWRRDQRRDQRWCGIASLSWSQQLRERRAVITSPLERPQGMLCDIEFRELPDPTQGRIEQRLKTKQARFLFMMQEGKVLLWMLRAIGLNRVLQQGHDLAQPPLVLHPRVEYVDSHTRQIRSHLDEMPLRLRFFFESPLRVAALSRD